MAGCFDYSRSSRGQTESAFTVQQRHAHSAEWFGVKGLLDGVDGQNGGVNHWHQAPEEDIDQPSAIQGFW
jgi:hypothetical protein